MSSPSSLARESACIASVVLPHAQSTSPRAWRGTELHRFLATAAEHGREHALALVEDEWREAARAIDFARMPAMDQSTGRPEVTVAWWPETGEAKELPGPGRPGHDDAVATHREAGWFVGTADWTGVTTDTVVVIDWKFGYAPVARARDNLQLAAYAVTLAALFGKARATVGIGRVHDNGDPRFDVETLDELQLEQAAGVLRRHLRKVEAAKLAHREANTTPMPHEGEHCRFCPAFTSCPAKVRLLTRALGGDLQREPVLTAADAGTLYPRLVEAQRLLARQIQNIEDMAREVGPLPLPDGMVLAQVDRFERDLEPELTADYVAGHLSGVAVADVVTTKRTATIKDLSAAVRATLGPRDELAPAMRKVAEEMKKTGALRVWHTSRVEVVKPDSKRIAPGRSPQTLEEDLRASLETVH